MTLTAARASPVPASQPEEDGAYRRKEGEGKGRRKKKKEEQREERHGSDLYLLILPLEMDRK